MSRSNRVRRSISGLCLASTSAESGLPTSLFRVKQLPDLFRRKDPFLTDADTRQGLLGRANVFYLLEISEEGFLHMETLRATCRSCEVFEAAFYGFGKINGDHGNSSRRLRWSSRPSYGLAP